MGSQRRRICLYGGSSMPQPEQPGSPMRPDLIAVRPRRYTLPWVGACLWLFCFQFFIAEQIARLGWTGHYSMTRDSISDLGAVRCSGSVGGSACSSLHRVIRSVCQPAAMRWKSWITFGAGAVGLLAFRGTPSWTAVGWEAGTVERLAAYPLPLCLTWTGLLMLKG